MLFSTRELSKSYGPFIALRDLSIDVEEGAVGLLGPNGAGKSTLLRILLGLIIPSSGDYTILDSDSSTPFLLDRVGYMPEHECLNPNFSAVGFVSYMAQLAGLPPDTAMERTHDVLGYVGLEDERYREIESYSSGMKQRVKLAQALVHDPDVVFFDEPTNGMDPSGREEILDLLRDITSMGKSILLSSHLLPDVEYVCDEVVILNNGELLTQGNIKKLLGSKELKVRIRGDKSVFIKKLEKEGCKISVKGEEIQIEEEEASKKIFKIAAQEDIQIRYMGYRSRSLEELFLELVEEESGYQH